jgi:hypothetical protein
MTFLIIYAMHSKVSEKVFGAVTEPSALLPTSKLTSE